MSTSPLSKFWVKTLNTRLGRAFYVGCLWIQMDYQVWIGQDQGTCGPNNNPIVAVDIFFPNMTFLDNITSSTSKNSLLQDVSEQQEEQEENNPLFGHHQLTQQRLRMHTYSIGRGTPYNPCQQLWCGGGGGGNQNQHTTTHHLMDQQPDKPKKKAPHPTKRSLEVTPVIETASTRADENNAHLNKTKTAKAAVLVQQLPKQQEPSISISKQKHQSAQKPNKPSRLPRRSSD